MIIPSSVHSIICAFLVAILVAGCDSRGPNDQIQDLYYEAIPSEPLGTAGGEVDLATHADFTIVAHEAGGPGVDTLRFANVKLPWDIKLKNVDTFAKPISFEACTEKGVLKVELYTNGSFRYSDYALGREFTPYKCAWTRWEPGPSRF